MKLSKSTRHSAKSDFTTVDILRALRRARRSAIKTARQHGLPILYRKNGKIVREYP